MARDNFAPAVISNLKARVSMRCSNPDCQASTSAPSTTDESSVTNIGVAAHITAAAPKGPRYDKKMSSSMRSGIENAIWLCSNCSTIIDRDVKKYTVSFLKKWKKDAENLAITELGKKRPALMENPPVETSAIHTLTTALTGLPTSFNPIAISNIHNASAKALESLDPRFSVKTAYQDNTTFFSINAKEDVPFILKTNNEIKDEYASKYKQLVKHGIDLEISSSAITIEGSKLLEETFNRKNGTIIIKSKQIPSIQKMVLVQDGTNIVESLDDIKGYVTFGTESFSFQGNCFNEIINFKYQKFLNDDKHISKFNLVLNLKKWENIELNSLPYFEKIITFFSRIVDGWKLSTTLEIDGDKILTGNGIATDKEEFFLNNNSHLQYIRCCRIISKHMKIQLKYKSDITYSKNELLNLFKIANIFEKKEIYDKNILLSNATCNIEIIDENLNSSLIKTLSNPTSIQVVANNNESINLFGLALQLPRKVISLTNVAAKLEKGIKADQLKIGDKILVEWVPQDNFQYAETYKDD